MTVYSYSRLSAYEECPLKYKLHYIDGIVPEEEGIEAFMGSRVHEALERLYRDKIRGRLNSLDELLSFYRERWEKEWGENIKIRREGYSPQDYFQCGLRAIKNYYKHYHPFEQATTLWTERTVHFELGGRYKMMGIIDRLDKTSEGVYEIHDYKTSAHLPPLKRLESDRQLSLYHIALLREFPEAKEVHLVWHYLLHDHEFRMCRSEEELKRVEEECCTLIEEIEGAEEFPPKEGPLCNWCDYWQYCPLKKHLVKIEHLAVSERKAEEGYALVDQYAQVKGEVEALKSELEGLKAQILEYGRREGLSVLRGSTALLRISTYTQKRLPAPKTAPEQFREVRDLLKEWGIWEEYATLDAHKLLKDVSSFAPEMQKRLRHYIQEKSVSTIRLSSLRKEE